MPCDGPDLAIGGHLVRFSVLNQPHDFATLLLAGPLHGRHDPSCGAIGDGAHWVIGQVGVTFGCAGLLMPEHFADHEQVYARRATAK